MTTSSTKTATTTVWKRLHGADPEGAKHSEKIAKMSLELLGLLLELLLPLLYAFIT